MSNGIYASYELKFIKKKYRLALRDIALCIRTVHKHGVTADLYSFIYYFRGRRRKKCFKNKKIELKFVANDRKTGTIKKIITITISAYNRDAIIIRVL